MAERRHGAAFDQLDGADLIGPLPVALPGEFGPPAELARRRCDAMFDGPPQSRLRADAAEDDDLTARFEDPGEFIKRSFGVRHRRHDILRYDDVKRIIGKFETLGVHDFEAFDMTEPQHAYAFTRLVEHGFGNIDTDDAVGARIVRQGDAGADADFENAAADTFGGRDRGTPAALEHRSEHEVVNRRPAVVGFFQRELVDVGCYLHSQSPCHRL